MQHFSRARFVFTNVDTQISYITGRNPQILEDTFTIYLQNQPSLKLQPIRLHILTLVFICGIRSPGFKDIPQQQLPKNSNKKKKSQLTRPAALLAHVLPCSKVGHAACLCLHGWILQPSAASRSQRPRQQGRRWCQVTSQLPAAGSSGVPRVAVGLLQDAQSLQIPRLQQHFSPFRSSWYVLHSNEDLGRIKPNQTFYKSSSPPPLVFPPVPYVENYKETTATDLLFFIKRHFHRTGHSTHQIYCRCTLLRIDSTRILKISQ